MSGRAGKVGWRHGRPQYRTREAPRLLLTAPHPLHLHAARHSAGCRTCWSASSSLGIAAGVGVGLAHSAGRDLERRPLGRHRPHGRRPRRPHDDDPSVDAARCTSRSTGCRAPPVTSSRRRSGRNWQSSEMPVGVNPKTQEAVYRAIGRGGVVIVGEGARGRLTRLVNDERSKVQRVASGVPVTVIYVGHGEGDVPISKLASTIKSLPKKVDRSTMAAVIKRVDSVSQSLTSLPIPKGIDPTKVARSAPALTAMRLRPGAGPSRPPCRAAPRCRHPRSPRGSRDQQQACARSGRHSPGHPPVDAHERAVPKQAVAGAAPMRRDEDALDAAKTSEDRQRVPCEERVEIRYRAAPVDEDRPDAPTESRELIRRPPAGSPSRSPG